MVVEILKNSYFKGVSLWSGCTTLLYLMLRSTEYYEQEVIENILAELDINDFYGLSFLSNISNKYWGERHH